MLSLNLNTRFSIHELMKKAIVFFGLFALLPALLNGQDNIHRQSTEYSWPTDPLVREKLETWRDQKFGMIIHWGVYAVPGMIESWALCSEDWITRDSTVAYEDYKKWYWGLSEKFNPQQFDPDQWAKAAKAAGMRYLVFTTKHHDGFSMFDSKYSDYTIAKGPFASHPKADAARHVFESFRKEGLMIGAYFSKPDWHSEYFWWPNYATPDRNVNYDIRKNPWRWNKFKEFTHNQIDELMTGYGKIDILWLDGGWVRPLDTVNDEVRAWGAAIPPWSQDIDMKRIASSARKSQPGLLVVDRTVHGEFENYQTPEQRIPDHKLDNPWESCITLGGAWGYAPNDNFKSSHTVVHLLTEVVAKGGSLLLGVGPTPEGLLLPVQVQRLQEIGDWLKDNGAAIYGTRPIEHYSEGSTYFTGNKDSSVNAIVLLPEGKPIPATVSWKSNLPKGDIRLVATNAKVKYKVIGDNVVVTLPRRFVKSRPGYPAIAFTYSVK